MVVLDSSVLDEAVAELAAMDEEARASPPPSPQPLPPVRGGGATIAIEVPKQTNILAKALNIDPQIDSLGNAVAELASMDEYHRTSPPPSPYVIPAVRGGGTTISPPKSKQAKAVVQSPRAKATPRKHGAAFEWAMCCQAALSALANAKAVARLQELKTMSAPPQIVKDVLAAILIALGHPGEPSWAEAVAFLQRYGCKGLVAKLTGFDPATITPAITRKLARRVATLDAARFDVACGAGTPLALWVLGVYKYGAKQEARLSNLAVLSPRLAAVPYPGLARYGRSDTAKPTFCWQQHAGGAAAAAAAAKPKSPARPPYCWQYVDVQ